MGIGEVTARAVLGAGLLCALATCKPEGLFNGIDAGSAGTGGTATSGSGSGGAVGSGGSGNGTGGSGSGTGGSVPGTGGAAGRGTSGTGGSAGPGGQSGTGGGIAGSGTGGIGTGGQGIGGGAVVRVLSIDFVGAMTTSAGGAGGVTVLPLAAMAATEVAGVQPVANWNSASGTMGSLLALTLADGTVTSAGVTWNSPPQGTNPGVWRLGYVDAPGDVRMMNGYLDPTLPTLPATITISGLPASMTVAGYDVYVYTSGDVSVGQSRGYAYSIGAATATVTQVGPSPTVFSGYTRASLGGAGNFVVFANIAGASFTLTATPGTGVPTRAPVNGIQIVSPAGGAI